MGLKLAVLPGDGVESAVTTNALNALQTAGRRFDQRFNFKEGLVGGVAIDTLGKALSYETLYIVVEYAKAGLERLVAWDSI